LGLFHGPQTAPVNRIRTIYACKGETVTCEHGHKICEFMVDVYLGDIQDVKNQLGNWRQTEPVPGTIPLPRCAICGARFILSSGIFHFSKGWRDPYDQIVRHNLLAEE
jgi:hypothetical protein